MLFDAKAGQSLSFEAIAQQLGRSEVAVAALFYGQAAASQEDVEKLSNLLGIPLPALEAQLLGFPDRGRAGPMPPVEPLIYRLYEIVQNYGYAYKAVLNEKFGDGIMSAIAFETKVEKEVDEAGNPWAVITLKGKWWVPWCQTTRGDGFANHCVTGCRSLGFNWMASNVVDENEGTTLSYASYLLFYFLTSTMAVIMNTFQMTETNNIDCYVIKT